MPDADAPPLNAPAHAVAVRQLFHVYCHRIDQGTPEDLAGLFAPDAKLVLAFDRDRALHGRAAIRDWFAGYMTETRRRSRPNRHWIADLNLSSLAAATPIETHVDASGLLRAEPRLETYRGHYRDTVAVRDGRCFFQHREIHLWDSLATSAVTRLRTFDPFPALTLRAWNYEESARRYFSDETPAPMLTTAAPAPVAYPAAWLDSDGVPVPTETEAAAMLDAEQALNRFAHAFDSADAAAFAALLTADARLEIDGEAATTALRGPGEFAAWHRARRSLQRRQLLVPVVHAAGDTAEILAYLTIDKSRDAATPAVEFLEGRWEARLTRADSGAWRIAALRELHFFTHTSLPRVPVNP